MRSGPRLGGRLLFESQSFLMGFLPLGTKLFHRLARSLLPQVVLVTPEPSRFIQLAHDVGVILVRDPVEEISRGPIAGIIFGPSQVSLGNLRAPGLRLVKEPADVVGNSLHEPA